MKPMDLSGYRETILKTSRRWHRETSPPSHCHWTAWPGAPPGIAVGRHSYQPPALSPLFLHRPWPLQIF